MRGLLLMALVLTGCAKSVRPRIVMPADPPTWSSGNKPSCQGGCAFVRPTGPSSEEIEALLTTVNATAVGADSEALDMLLFHADETARSLADARIAMKLGPQWRAWLREELDRDTAMFSLRVIDENGVTRSELSPTAMKLGSKLHMAMAGERLAAFNANGTIVRVGRDHVWIRM